MKCDVCNVLEYRLQARLSRPALADRCGVSLSTVRRWERQHRAPRAVCALLEVLAGDLEALTGNRAWRGWIVQGDRIFYGQDQRPAILAGQMGYWEWLHAENERLRRELKQVRRARVVLEPGAREAVQTVRRMLEELADQGERVTRILGTLMDDQAERVSSRVNRVS